MYYPVAPNPRARVGSNQPLIQGFSYRPDVDGLRAVAILAVMAGHIELLRGGSAGVDIFFVISGFLISGIILRELKNGSFSLATFYARRVRRIFPALITLLATVWAFGWL